MSAQTERVSNLSLQKQITEFAARLDQVARDVTEIKAVVKSVEERVRALETHEAGTHPLIEARVGAAWRKIEDHERRLGDLAQVVSRLEHSNRLLTWLGGILGSTVVIWLLSEILQVIQ